MTPNRLVGYNSISIGDNSEIFVPKDVSWVYQLNVVTKTCLRRTPVATVTKVCVFYHKIDNKSVCIYVLHKYFIKVPDNSFHNLEISNLEPPFSQCHTLLYPQKTWHVNGENKVRQSARTFRKK